MPNVLPETTTAYSIVKDGFLPGYIPGFRVVCVMVDRAGKARVEASSQKYVLGEAQAIVEEKLREGLGL